MENDYFRKDRNPEETIKVIRKILKRNHIKVKENILPGIIDGNYSVRLNIKGFHNLGTNGKGIQKTYARASAYAELMERLQGKLLIKDDFLLKQKEKCEFSEDCIMNTNEIEEFLKVAIQDYEIFIRYKNFVFKNEYYKVGYDVEELISHQYKRIPIPLINMFTHSNGLCAGNNKEEAIIQGVCEIFERYCYKKMLFEKINANIIKYCNPLLEQLINAGYSYNIVDCSLGIYPVVGLIIFDKECKNYLFSMGADPNFQIAVSRCITEVFQGLNKQRLQEKMKPVDGYGTETGLDFLNTNWLMAYSSNNGIIPKSLLYVKNESETIPSVFTKETSTKKCYSYLLDLIKRNNLQLYCQNLSFLGFPTYKLYIPSISEIEWQSEDELFCIRNKERLSKTILNIKGATNLEIQFFINSFLPLINLGKYHLMLPANYFHTQNYINSALDKLTFPILLIVLNIMIENYSQAQAICTSELQSIYNNNNNKNIVNSISFLLENKDYISLNKALQRLNFPTCPMCKICPCIKSCKFTYWKKLSVILDCKYSNWQ